MRKRTKVTRNVLVTAAALFIAGVILCAASFAMGFRNISLQSDIKDEDERVLIKDVIEEPVESVVIKSHSGTVYVETGKDFSIKAATPGDTYISTVVDGVWTIETVEQRHRANSSIGDFVVDNQGLYVDSVRSHVWITIPDDVKLEQLAIDNYSGFVRMDKAACRILNVTQETGEIEFTVDPGELAFISNRAGHVHGTLSGLEENYHMNLKSDLGKVAAGRTAIGPLTSREFNGTKEEKILQISNGAGEVIMRFNAT